MKQGGCLRDMGAGFTSLALADMMSQDGFLSSTAHAADGSAWQNPLKAKAPMFAPYHGFHVAVPGGKGVLNYGEGFNYTMVIDEVRALGKRFRPDIVLAAAQLEFEEYAASGAAALGASTVILHHPHQKLFEKINVTSSPPDVFVAAVTEKMPDAEVHYAQPGFSWP